MGLKPYFTNLLNPWLKPEAIDENIFYLMHSQLNKKIHLNAVLTCQKQIKLKTFIVHNQSSITLRNHSKKKLIFS